MTEPVTIGNATLYCGDALTVLPTLGPVGAVITDPPYSSGGQFRSDRMQSTTAKYVKSEDRGLAYHNDFSGDNRDQRGFYAWATLVFTQLYDITAAGGVIYVFSDWRQLPTMTDAIQGGGYIWRNIVTWWKPAVRMQKGRFSSSAEYILAGSKGKPMDGERSLQNVLRHNHVPSEIKRHTAEKPVGLLSDLVSVTPSGTTVLDPFMGSGATGDACIQTERPFIGIEKDPAHFETACERIDNAQRQQRLAL